MQEISDTNKPNPEAPHQAVILVRYEINERDELGRMLPKTLKSASKVFTFLGKDFKEAEDQVNSFLERITNATETTKKIEQSQAP